MASYPKDAPRRFTLDSFKRILDVGQVPTNIAITYMGACEPWVNPEATQIIRYGMKERGNPGSWSTTLVGITHADIDAVADLDPSDTVVHVPADDGRMNVNVDDKWLSLFEHAIAAWRHHRDFVISVFEHAPHPKIRAIWEKSGIPIPCFALHSRCGQIPWLGKVTHQGPLPLCSKRFRGHLYPNGWLARCCNDWTPGAPDNPNNTTWGNLWETPYKEMFRSEKFRQYMRKCGSDSEPCPCRNCSDSYRQTNYEHQHLSYANPCEWPA